MAHVLKVVSPPFKVVNYSQQFLIIGIIPNFKPLEFSIIKCHQSLIKLSSV